MLIQAANIYLKIQASICKNEALFVVFLQGYDRTHNHYCMCECSIGADKHI